MSRKVAAEKLSSLDPKRICLIKPSALGDVVQTLPLLPVLKECYPEATITWVINKNFVDLLADHPLIDELLIFDRRGAWSSWWDLIKTLRARQFDLVFDLQGLFRTGVMTAATRAPVRVGLETAREGSHLTTNCTIPGTTKSVPAHARNWKLAKVLGKGDHERKVTLGLSDETNHWAWEKLQSLGRPTLAISPGGQWVTKRWPIEKYAEVAFRAIRELGLTICLVGSKAERELTAQLEALVRESEPHASLFNLAGETSLRQLAALLQQADLMLSNDSGPLHLAAELGTPSVGVFLCTDPARSGPPGDRHIMVSTEVDCRASYKKVCPQTGAKHLCCFEELSTERVFSAVKQQVERHLRHSEVA